MPAILPQPYATLTVTLTRPQSQHAYLRVRCGIHQWIIANEHKETLIRGVERIRALGIRVVTAVKRFRFSSIRIRPDQGVTSPLISYNSLIFVCFLYLS